MEKEDLSLECSTGSKNELLIGSMTVYKPQYKVLLVFPKEDRYYRMLVSALDKLKFKHENVRKTDEVLNALNKNHLIIVDCRYGCSIEIEQLCRSVKSKSTSSMFKMVALTSNRRYRSINRSQNRIPCLIKCSYFKRNHLEENFSVREYLRMGFCRVITETNIIDDVEDELMQIEAEPLANQTRFRSCLALFTAIERTSYSVLIADNQHRIQFANKKFEEETGLKVKDIMGKKMNRYLTPRVPVAKRTDLKTTSGFLPDTQASIEEVSWEHVHQKMRANKEWKGWIKITNPKTTSDKLYTALLLLRCGEKSEDSVYQYILVLQEDYKEQKTKDSANEVVKNTAIVTTTSPIDIPPSSYNRRPSNTSEGDCKHNRANSLAKIQSMAIEAPITQIINLIDRVKHNSQPSVGEVLDQILEILRNSELYTPADLQNKSQDPMVSDLIEGLVTGPAFGHRRSSGGQNVISKSVSGLLSNQQHNLVGIPSIPSDDTLQEEDEPVENEKEKEASWSNSYEKYLQSFESWDYNIFELEKITLKTPLVHVGMHALNKFNVCSVLQCSQNTMHAWLRSIEAKYHASNPYHNSTHAADVLHATAYFLTKDRLQSWMDPHDQAAILLAAIIHDVDHPGRTNAFLINTSDPLALLYNDTAVLEMHHAASAFKFTVNDEKANIFKNMPRDSFLTLRQSMIDMVLATELTKHFEHVNKFISIVTKSNSAVLDQESGCLHQRVSRAPSGANSKETQDLKNLIKRVMIKVADVCNQVKPRQICMEWTRRISEEYSCQSEEELKLGMSPTLPLFERSTCNLPKSQSSFIEWFLIDMCEAWHEFCGIEELVDHLHQNLNYWKFLESIGIKNFDELKASGLAEIPDEQATITSFYDEDNNASSPQEVSFENPSSMEINNITQVDE